METLSQKIKDLRQEYNLTQRGLAAKIQTSHVSIGKWESNVHTPNADDLAKLAKVFDVSADYLLGLADDTAGYIALAQAAPSIPTPPIVPLYNQLTDGDKLRAEEYIKLMLTEPKYTSAVPSLA